MFSFFFVWKQSSVILLMYALWMLMISVKFLALLIFVFRSWLMKCSTVVMKWLSSDCNEYINQLRSNAKRLNVKWTMFGSPYSTVFLKWPGKRRFSNVQMPHFILSRKRKTKIEIVLLNWVFFFFHFHWVSPHLYCTSRCNDRWWHCKDVHRQHNLMIFRLLPG